MTYHVVARWGDSEKAPNETRMREILAQLDVQDAEHPDTWLTHESGWTLSVHESGLVVWENMESSDGPRHQIGISREKALDLWLSLSRGELLEIEKEPWCPGQCPTKSPEKLAEHARKAEEAIIASFRKFYDGLNSERADVPCRHQGCTRGAIQYGVFCRVHHFENIYHRPCPFHD